MRVFFLSFISFILSTLFLLPLLSEGLRLPDSYLIFAPLTLMILSVLMQIDSALTYRKLLQLKKYERDNDRLNDEIKDLNAKLHLEKKAVTDMRRQMASSEKEIRQLGRVRDTLTSDLNMAVAEKLSLQTAFQDALRKQKEAEERFEHMRHESQNRHGAGEREVLHLLAMLQDKGRFLDFLKDDIARYPDAQIGAAARVVHQGCLQVINEYFDINPLSDAKEGSTISIGERYHPKEYRLLGRVSEPPFEGTLLHRGWQASRVNWPHMTEDSNEDFMANGIHVITPAEVELS